MTAAQAGAPRIAVVGGGITGLTAAHRLRTLLGPGAAVDLYEGSGRLGGKLRTVRVGGAALDVGAEAFLARRPEMPALLAELGLAGEMVHPSGRSPRLRAGGRLHPVPAGTLMGIPADPAATGLLGDGGAEALRRDGAPLHWEPGSDSTVGELVEVRYGPEAVRRCVDPLLGGVYSGSAGGIGVRAALPGLAAALDAGAASLRAAVAAALESAQATARPGPVFGALRGGYGRLVDALAAAASPALHLHTTVTGLAREDGRWRLALRGGDGAPGAAAADAVILALPAPRTAELLAGPAPAAADAAARIRLADSAVVAVALDAGVALPDCSGVLVATGEPGVGAKACTLSSRKWPHLEPAGADGVQLLRLSYGRFGAAEVVGEPDAALAARARRDLRALLGVDAEPADVHVQRWRGGLPQYGAGHGRIVDAVEDAVSQVPGLAIAGSAWHGVGVPACVAGGRAAAESVVADITG